MRVAIMQPAYLPWAGYIQRAMYADVHVVLDHVKIDWHSKTQFTNRNKVLTVNGPTWLTIPLSKKESEGMRINSIRISANEHWERKHWMTISQNYAKAPYFFLYRDAFFSFYEKKQHVLVDALEASTRLLLSAFGCSSKQVKSSDLNVPGSKDELILNICMALNADTYISGPFGREYLNVSAFKKAGIKVLFHDFVPFEYPQTRPGFVPFLSAVDMLFNVSSEHCQDFLTTHLTLAEQ